MEGCLTNLYTNLWISLWHERTIECPAECRGNNGFTGGALHNQFNFLIIAALLAAPSAFSSVVNGYSDVTQHRVINAMLTFILEKRQKPGGSQQVCTSALLCPRNRCRFSETVRMWWWWRRNDGVMAGTPAFTQWTCQRQSPA